MAPSPKDEWSEFDAFMLDEYGKWKVGRAEIKAYIKANFIPRSSVERVAGEMMKVIEGMKRRPHLITQPSGYKGSDANVWREGYNTALTDITNSIRKEV